MSCAPNREASDVVRRNELAEAEWSAYAQQLAVALRRVRQEAGLSQEDVAYGAGMSRYTYQKYEKGESRPGMPANPSLRSLFAIAQALGVGLDAILPGGVPDLRSR